MPGNGPRVAGRPRRSAAQPNPGGGRRVLQYVLTALLPIVIAAGVTWYVAPWQEKRVQQSVEREQSSRPPLEVAYAADASFEEPDSFVLPSAPSAALASYLAGPNLDQQRLASMARREGGLEVVTIDGLDLSSGGRTANKLRLTLVGRSPDPVLVTGISARIVGRAAPWSAGLIFTSPQGSVATEAIGFDLTGSDLRARRMTADTPLSDLPGAPPYLADRQVTLSDGEKLTFDVVTLVSGGSYDWVIDVRTANGFVLTASNHGRPWRSSALSPAYAQAWSRNFAPDLSYRSCHWPDCDAVEVS